MRALGASRTSLVPGGVLAGPWVRDGLWRRARAVPSLDLRFADNKSLVDAVTGASLVTFTRASSGTFVDSAGVLQTAATDVPRFDHNPTTGESLGLLVEEQRTNLRLNSATYQPTSGAAPAAYTVDQVAPDGTTTGSRQTAATPRTLEDYIGIANALYTFSFYCRVTSGTAAFQIQLKNAASDTVIASDTSPVATTTWKRFSISGTTGGAIPGARVELQGVVPGFVFWGADLQAGAFPTSHIPTTTAAVTRSADVASITGSAFSSWYNAAEGTVFGGSATLDPSTLSPVLASINDATTSNRIQIGRTNSSGAALRVFVISGGATSVNGMTVGSSSTAQSGRLAFAYKADDFAGAYNSVLATPDLSGSLPTVSRLEIGVGVGGGIFNGTIRRLTFWGQRLPNNILQSITQ